MKKGFTGMVTLRNFSDCCRWRELPTSSFGDSIGCKSCSFVERLIMDVIVSVIVSYWGSCGFEHW